MKIVLIDNYDSFTFNLYQMLRCLLGEDSEESVVVFRNDKIDFPGIQNIKPDRIVLSPGPGHPANESDFGVCRDVILRQDQLGCPVLGVCLGHQGIAQHLGGTVVRAPEIVHGKMSEIVVEGDVPLFHGLPKRFKAMRYHSLVAQEKDLPKELSVTAREAKGNLIMALAHKKRSLHGVQFHPESIGTPEGKTILRNFLERC